jgi:hypothetical protein
MPDFEITSLGISPTVRGRDRRRNRVTYQLWNNSDVDQPVIAEKIVLKRFCHRSTEMIVRDGARLQPSLWRAVDRLLTDHPDFFAYPFDDEAGQGRMHEALAGIREPLRMANLKLPRDEVTARLIYTLGPDKVHQLVIRHRDPGRAAAPGVPDLVLFERSRMTHRLHRFLFVEVKRPDEHLMAHQAAELAFMRSLGLEAGVYRLREVGSGRLQSHAA